MKLARQTFASIALPALFATACAAPRVMGQEPVALDRVDYLINELLYARDDDDREDAAEDLGKLRDPRALPALQQAAIYDDEDDVRDEARKAIRRIEERSVVVAVAPPVVVEQPVQVVRPVPVVVRPAPVIVTPPPVVVTPQPVVVHRPVAYVRPAPVVRVAPAPVIVEGRVAPAPVVVRRAPTRHFSLSVSDHRR